MAQDIVPFQMRFVTLYTANFTPYIPTMQEPIIQKPVILILVLRKIKRKFPGNLFKRLEIVLQKSSINDRGFTVYCTEVV